MADNPEQSRPIPKPVDERLDRAAHSQVLINGP